MMIRQSYSTVGICQFLLLLVNIYNAHLDVIITSLIIFHFSSYVNFKSMLSYMGST